VWEQFNISAKKKLQINPMKNLLWSRSWLKGEIQMIYWMFWENYFSSKCLHTLRIPIKLNSTVESHQTQIV
jgi:hypothetical protein